MNKDDKYPLHIAAELDQGQVMTVLLRGEATKNVLNRNGESPLFNAAKKDILPLPKWFW